MILAKTYFPRHDDNRMINEGDLQKARTNLIENKPSNLMFLLESRYSWMQPYLVGKEDVYELGAGAGFSKIFLVGETNALKLTDFVKYDWIDQRVDALNLPFDSESVDVLICSHMIHHLANPMEFFDGVRRVLKKDGVLLISEINTSFVMRVLLRVMRHEGWSYEKDVFDRQELANDPVDPWSANCAIPELLFGNVEKFEKNQPGLKVERNELCEGMIFPLSGGVIAKTKTVNLPRPALQGVSFLDSILIKLFPKIFALGRRVVIRKH